LKIPFLEFSSLDTKRCSHSTEQLPFSVSLGAIAGWLEEWNNRLPGGVEYSRTVGMICLYTFSRSKVLVRARDSGVGLDGPHTAPGSHFGTDCRLMILT